MKKRKIFKDKHSLKNELSGIKNLAFVPTMGGLHKGHTSLIKKAQIHGRKVLVSIYVNPKQFNSKKDFHSYPKNEMKDLNFLRKLRVDYVYIPTFNDVYLFKTRNRVYEDKQSKILCGKYRKLHFKGVLDVVNRLIEIIEPKKIVLGEKDYQQLFLIKKHIKKNNINTKILSCKTIREKNGMPCSSRNFNLSKKEKKIASKVYYYLKKEKKNISQKNLFKYTIANLKKKILKFGVKKIDYIEFISLKNLKKIKSNKQRFNIFISYYLRHVRLIDNF